MVLPPPLNIPLKRFALFFLWGIMVVFCGMWGTWSAGMEQSRLRSDLLRNARLLAEGLDMNLVSRLASGEAGLDSPEYRRLKSQLQLYRTHLSPGIDVQYVYLLAPGPNEVPRFLCDDADIGEEDEAPLGLLYEDAPKEVRDIIRAGTPGVTAPYADRWGRFYSAYWPLKNSLDGAAVASVGIDQPAELGNRRLRQARWFPQVYFLAVYTLICLCGLAMFTRKRNPLVRWSRRRILWEVGLTLAFGCTTSLALALAYDQQQDLRLSEAFLTFSEIRSGQISNALQDIRDRDLRSFQGFMIGQDDVTENEFSGFADILSPDALVAAWHWIGRDASGNSPVLRKSIITAAALEQVAADLPLEEPHLAEMLRQGFQEGLPQASPVHDSDFHHEPGSLLLAPLVKDGSPTPDGFVAALLLWPRLLAHQERTPAILDVQLFDLNPDGAVNVRQIDAMAPVFAGTGGMRDVRPVFAFGRLFAILTQPTAEFLSHYPARGGLAVFAFSLILTSVIALVFWISGRSREHLEVEIEERTSDLRHLFNNSVNAIATHRILLDADGIPVDYVFLSVNPAFEKITGLSAASVIGRKVTDVIPDVSPDLIQRYGRVALSGVSDSFEYADPVLKRTYQITAYTTGVQMFAVVFEDITEIEEHAREKLALQQQLTQAQKMESIGRLAGGVAHDFNNTLQVVLGNAELALKFMAMDESLRANLLEIKDAAFRSSQLTRQLLAFARKENVQPVPVNLNELVGSSLKMLQRLIGENIQLDWEPCESVWTVWIDPGQVDQILINLIVNSRDALPNGGRIRLQTRNLSADDRTIRAASRPPGECVLLRVEDNGCGIPDHILPLIFEPFVTTKPAGHGTGLGLSTVYGIVEQNKGHISVQSREGEGTVFSIVLPRDTSVCPASVPAAPVSSFKHSGTILLVEDDPMILQLGVMLLTKLGFTVISADCGEKAIERMRERKAPIDLLLTDVVMPGMNGQQLAHELSALQPGLKCLYMSGYTADIIGAHGVLDEGVAFVAKPFSMEDLAAKLQEIFRRPS